MSLFKSTAFSYLGGLDVTGENVLSLVVKVYHSTLPCVRQPCFFLSVDSLSLFHSLLLFRAGEACPAALMDTHTLEV